MSGREVYTHPTEDGYLVVGIAGQRFAVQEISTSEPADVLAAIEAIGNALDVLEASGTEPIFTTKSIPPKDIVAKYSSYRQ